jgi:hypothetical protein
MGQTAKWGLGADGNVNGVIDDGDYDVWKANFDISVGGGGSYSTVPEPSSILFILAIAGAAIAGRWQPQVKSSRR